MRSQWRRESKPSAGASIASKLFGFDGYKFDGYRKVKRHKQYIVRCQAEINVDSRGASLECMSVSGPLSTSRSGRQWSSSLIALLLREPGDKLADSICAEITELEDSRLGFIKALRCRTSLFPERLRSSPRQACNDPAHLASTGAKLPK